MGSPPDNSPEKASEGGPGILVPREAIEDHLLHLAWPGADDETRRGALPVVDETVERLVESGAPEYRDGALTLFDPVDALNLFRTLARSGGDLLWHAYVERLRAEVDHVEDDQIIEELDAWPALESTAASAPAEVRCEIRRTVVNDGLQPVRIALPEPATHALLENGSVEIVGSSHPLVNRESIGGTTFVTLEAGASDTAWVDAEVRGRVSTFKRTTGSAAQVNGWQAETGEATAAVSDYIRSVAKNAAGSDLEAAEIIRRLYQFCFRWLSAGFVYRSSLDPADPLRSIVSGGWFDASTGSELLAQLAQASGLRARTIYGLHLVAPYPTWTAWTEIDVPGVGVLPFDLFASWELASGDPNAIRWASRFYGQLDYRFPVAGAASMSPSGRRPADGELVIPSSTADGTVLSYYGSNGAMAGQDRLRLHLSVSSSSRPTLSDRLRALLRRG